MDLQTLKFPIGTYQPNTNPSPDQLAQWIERISTFPTRLKELVADLYPEQLGWIYRPGGWNVRQVINHCADSHMNSFIRFKLALTEDNPKIRPYYEDRWAELPDGNTQAVHLSLDLLTGLHARWTLLLNHLSDTDLQRTFEHPEHGTTFNLAETIGNYAWHGDHHLAHITQALRHKGLFT